MAFFGGNDDTRRLEAQLHQKDCQLMNFESSLQRTKAELEQVKRDRDQLKLNVRAAHEKCSALEATSEKYLKDAKQKSEMCVSLHNQLTKWKREKEEIDRQVKEGSARFGAQSIKLEESEYKIKELQEERDRLKHWCQSNEKKLGSLKEDHFAEIQRLTQLLESKDKAAEKAVKEQVDKYPGSMSPNTVTQKLSQSNQILDKLKAARDDLSERQKENLDLKKQMAHLSEVNGKALRLENEVLTLQKQVRGFEGQAAEMGKLRRVLVRLEGRNSDLEGEVQGLKTELEKCATVEAENEQMKERCQVVEGIQFELNSTRSQLETKKGETDELQKQLSSLSEERQDLGIQVKTLRENIGRAKEAIQTKENMLDVERELTLEQQRRCETIHKSLRDAQAENGRLVHENEDLRSRNKRSNSIMRALEERIDKMKIEMADLHEKVGNINKDLTETQSEKVRLDMDLQLRSSELFDSKSEVARLKAILCEMESSKSTPDLGNSQIEIFEMESKFREERRLLECELAMEKKSHDETKGLLKQEQARFEQEVSMLRAAAVAAKSAEKPSTEVRPVRTSAASGSISLSTPISGPITAPTTVERQIPSIVDFADVMPTPSGKSDLPPTPMSGVGSPMSEEAEGPHNSPFFNDQPNTGALSFQTEVRDCQTPESKGTNRESLSFQKVGGGAGQEGTPPFSKARNSLRSFGQERGSAQSKGTNRTVSFIPVDHSPSLHGDGENRTPFSKSTQQCQEEGTPLSKSTVEVPGLNQSGFEQGTPSFPKERNMMSPLQGQVNDTETPFSKGGNSGRRRTSSILSPTNSSVYHSPGVVSGGAESDHNPSGSRRISLLARESIERERAPSPLSEDENEEEFVSAEGTISPKTIAMENCEPQDLANGQNPGSGARTVGGGESQPRIVAPLSDINARHSE